MRLVSYNILDGGEGRADALADVIPAQRPDVVALVEAENLEVVERIARRLGMDYIQAAGNSHASALLSRWTISDTVNHAALTKPLNRQLSKSLLEATVLEPSGRPWLFGVVHLHARATEADEDRRMREMEVLLSAFEPHRRANRPHLLCGDFNSNSPVQKIDPAHCKPRTRKDWEENGGGVPRRVVSRLLQAGYVDSLHAVNPVAAETVGSFSTEFPGQRVDYVLTWGVEPGGLKSAWVEQGGPAQGASDHFPVGVEVELGA
jgi:exodeoxyribonuclease-3